MLGCLYVSVSVNVCGSMGVSVNVSGNVCVHM